MIKNLIHDRKGMKLNMNRAFIYIITGAILWGTISIYVKNLYEFGFSPMEVVTLRVVSASIILTIYLLFKSPASLKLKAWKDIKYFIGTGVFSIIFFNYCMFKTIELATIPISAALLYTAPAFVIVLSYFLFNESLTTYKIIAFALTLVGTALVVGLIPFNLGVLKFTTILIGLGSGLGYALYSVFSKFALIKYGSLQITAFTFIVAAIALLPFFPYEEKFTLLLNPSVLFYAVGLGFLPTAVAYIVYTYGLQQTEASKASILATIEPVIATLIGIFIFAESFTTMQMIGMGAIIFAVILVNIETQGFVKQQE